MATFLTLKINLCNEFHVSDATSLNQSGTFLNFWYEHIWNSAVWNDAKERQTISYPAGSASVTLGSTAHFVIAASWDGNPINEVNQEEILTVNPEDLTNTGTPTHFINEPSDSSGNAILRLVPLPSETKNLLVLCKKKFVALSADSDVPKLKGIDEALMTFARASFLRQEYQYAKAEVAETKGNQMLMKMVDIENNQQQKSYQIIPEFYDAIYGCVNYRTVPAKDRIYG